MSAVVMKYPDPRYWALSEASDSTEELPDHVMFYIYPSVLICPANVIEKKDAFRHPMPSKKEADALWDARVNKGSVLTREEALDVLYSMQLAEALRVIIET